MPSGRSGRRNTATPSRNDGGVAINYVVQPLTTDYVLGLRSYNEDVFAFGAGFDVELAKGWQLSLLYRHEQADEVDSNAFALRLMFSPQAQQGAAISPVR